LDQVSCLPIPRDAGESVVRQAVTQTIQNVAQGLASEGMTVGSPGATPSHPLSEMLDRTADVIGNAPSEFKTPFAVVRVVPIEGEYCDLVLATYGMLYSVYAERRGGSCDLLPPPNALVWGRVRHSGLATALRMANVADLASDYVDLAHYKGGKIRADSYIISTGEAIGPDWGK